MHSHRSVPPKGDMLDSSTNVALLVTTGIFSVVAIIMFVFGAIHKSSSSSLPVVPLITPMHAYALQTDFQDYMTNAGPPTLPSGVSFSSNALYFSLPATDSVSLDYGLPRIYTVCVWVAIQAGRVAGVDTSFLSSANGDGQGAWIMGTSGTSTFVFQGHGHFSTCANNYYQTTGPYPQIATFVHSCFTDDGSRSKIYVRGELIADAPSIPWATDPDNIVIGKMDCVSLVLRGYVRGLGIYNKSISAQQIADMYAIQNTGNFTLASFIV